MAKEEIYGIQTVCQVLVALIVVAGARCWLVRNDRLCVEGAERTRLPSVHALGLISWEHTKREDTHLYSSEIIIIGLLSALKGGCFRAFYRYLNASYRLIFPKMPERSRLQRLLRDHNKSDNDFRPLATSYDGETIAAHKQASVPMNIC